MIRLTRNPKGGTYVKPQDYDDLGWQIHIGNNETLKRCHELGHNLKEFDNSSYLLRGTEVIFICDECKFIYHIDRSD